MDRNDQNRIRSFYQEAYLAYGDKDARSVHWLNTHNQIRRFQILLTVGDVENKRILDVGCGLGDLYGYLRENTIQTDYTGIDIVPAFIPAAQNKFPDGKFIYKDIFDVTDRYDFVFASGSLTFRVTDNDNFYKNMIRKMYDIANEAVAFNMLDKVVSEGDDTYATYYPDEISNYCKTFCDNVQVTVGYLPGDFSVFLYK